MNKNQNHCSVRTKKLHNIFLQFFFFFFWTKSNFNFGLNRECKKESGVGRSLKNFALFHKSAVGFALLALFDKTKNLLQDSSTPAAVLSRNSIGLRNCTCVDMMFTV